MCIKVACHVACYVLKYGFEMLNQLVPSLNQAANAKVSKAATLSRGWLFFLLKRCSLHLTLQVLLLLEKALFFIIFVSCGICEEVEAGEVRFGKRNGCFTQRS